MKRWTMRGGRGVGRKRGGAVTGGAFGRGGDMGIRKGVVRRGARVKSFVTAAVAGHVIQDFIIPFS
jgi:hypothetical protein